MHPCFTAFLIPACSWLFPTSCLSCFLFVQVFYYPYTKPRLYEGDIYFILPENVRLLIRYYYFTSYLEK